MREPRLVFVTGLSGAGKSTAAHALEDLRYWCVDNLPAALVDKLWQLAAPSRGAVEGLAVVCDVRDAALLEVFPRVFGEIRARGHQVDLVFLEAADDVLVERFARTGRRHPLATTAASPGEGGPAHSADEVLTALAKERTRLAPLRGLATEIVDSSSLTVHELRRHVVTRFSGRSTRTLEVALVSHSSVAGFPLEADVGLDAAILPLPAGGVWGDGSSGTDQALREAMLTDASTRRVVDRMAGLLQYWIPRCQREGKAYLTVGVGCRDGRLRSVALVRMLAERLASLGTSIQVRDRDLASG